MRISTFAYCFAAVALLAIEDSQSSWAASFTYDAGVDLKAYEASGNPGTGLAPGVNTVVPVWSYGTATGATTATPNSASFTVFPAVADYTSINLPGAPANSMAGWQDDPAGDLVPVVAVNTTNATVGSSCCGSYGVNQIWTHPGGSTSDEFTVVRWTAPKTGLATISGTFLNEGGTPSEDYILVGGTQEAVGPATPTTAPVPLTVGSMLVFAGETIDFITGPNLATGYGANSTSFDGTVTFVPAPEPSSIVALGGLCAMGLFAAVRRRRRS